MSIPSKPRKSLPANNDEAKGKVDDFSSHHNRIIPHMQITIDRPVAVHILVVEEENYIRREVLVHVEVVLQSFRINHQSALRCAYLGNGCAVVEGGFLRVGHRRIGEVRVGRSLGVRDIVVGAEVVRRRRRNLDVGGHRTVQNREVVVGVLRMRVVEDARAHRRRDCGNHRVEIEVDIGFGESYVEALRYAEMVGCRNCEMNRWADMKLVVQNQYIRLADCYFGNSQNCFLAAAKKFDDVQTFLLHCP